MSKKKKIIIIILLIVLGLIVFLYFLPGSLTCKMIGGNYTNYVAFSSVPACGFTPASDGGRRCSSDDDCINNCTVKGDLLTGCHSTCEEYKFWLIKSIIPVIKTSEGHNVSQCEIPSFDFLNK